MHALLTRPESVAARHVPAIGGLYVAQSVIGGITWSRAASRHARAGHAARPDRADLAGRPALGAEVPVVASGAAVPAAAAGATAPASSFSPAASCASPACVAVGAIGPAALVPMLACLTLVAFAASTVDIACDGFAVQSLAKENHGWGNAAQVGGAYLGSAIGAGLFLVLVDAHGWRAAVWAMAVLLSFSAAVPAAARSRDAGGDRADMFPRSPRRSGARRSGEACCGGALCRRAEDRRGDARPVPDRRGARPVGGRAAQRRGQHGRRALPPRSSAAQWSGPWACATFWCRRSVASRRAVLLRRLRPPARHSRIGADRGCGREFVRHLAFGFVALYAQFMRWSDARQAGIDFTLFQCMDALVSMAGGVRPVMLRGISAMALSSWVRPRSRSRRCRRSRWSPTGAEGAPLLVVALARNAAPPIGDDQVSVLLQAPFLAHETADVAEVGELASRPHIEIRRQGCRIDLPQRVGSRPAVPASRPADKAR